MRIFKSRYKIYKLFDMVDPLTPVNIKIYWNFHIVFMNNTFKKSNFILGIGKELWKTVTEVSIQGIKTGRKPKYRAKNLNAGQILGFGKARVAFKGNPATNYVFSKDDKNIKPKNLKLTVGEIPEAKLA